LLKISLCQLKLCVGFQPSLAKLFTYSRFYLGPFRLRQQAVICHNKFKLSLFKLHFVLFLNREKRYFWWIWLHICAAILAV